MRRRSRIYDLFVLPTNTEPPRTRFVVIWGNAFLLGFAVNTAIECFLEGRADYWVQLTVDRRAFPDYGRRNQGTSWYNLKNFGKSCSGFR